MTYSCSDFTDSIIEALGVAVDEADYDNPSAQADLCLSAIEAMKHKAELFDEARPALRVALDALNGARRYCGSDLAAAKRARRTAAPVFNQVRALDDAISKVEGVIAKAEGYAAAGSDPGDLAGLCYEPHIPRGSGDAEYRLVNGAGQVIAIVDPEMTLEDPAAVAEALVRGIRK